MNAPDPVAVIARPEFVPGVFEDMPMATYHAIEAMSASGAKKMIKTPRHFKVAREKPKPSTEDQELFTAIHTGVLEPAAFSERVVEAPEINRRTKDGRAEWAYFGEVNAGRTVLSRENYAAAQRSINSVLSHPIARRLLEGAQRELSLFWQDREFDVPVKGRLDIWSMGGVTDLKSTDDASPEAFGRIAAKQFYHLQGANYFSGAEHCLNVTPEFFALIGAETDGMHEVAVYTVPSAAILAGQRLMQLALERYSIALKTGEWAGYPLKIEMLPFPQYALRFDI